MRGFVVGVVLALSVTAAAGPRRPPKPKKTPVPPTATASATSACKSNVPADIDKQIEKATAARDAAYAKALADQKLTHWTGKVRVYAKSDDGYGDLAVKPSGPTPPPGAPKGVEIPLGSGGQYDTPKPELVADAKGTVFLVQRQPSGSGPYYTQCGCGPMGQGARVRVVSYFGELPAGTKFGGNVTISYPDNVPQLGWNMMQGGQPCQPPP